MVSLQDLEGFMEQFLQEDQILSPQERWERSENPWENPWENPMELSQKPFRFNGLVCWGTSYITGFTMVFTIKFLGVSGSNFPIIQFYERFAIGIFQRIFQKPEPISRRRQRAEFSFAPCAEE